MGPAARSARRRPHIGQRVRRQSETGRTPTWKRRETLSLEEHVGLFFRTCGKTIQGKCRRRSLRKKGGRTGIESDSDLIQTALANLALPDYFPDWLLSQNSMADAQRGVELLYRAIKSNIADSLHVVIEIKRRPGRRYVSEVLEINSYDPDATPSITVRSTRHRSHPNDDGRKSKHEGHLST